VFSLSFRAALAGLVLGALASSSAVAANANQGEQLAKRWCAACHVVADDQTHAADNVPTFASIARRPGISASKIATFLADPHPKMPDMQLGRTETADLAAYIMSLGR
jgi:mono/diheme cytochrome c family protein